jgi:hypothetical protein
VVDDQVGHEVEARTDPPDVAPVAEAGIDLRVIYRVEPGISAIDRVEERQQVHASEGPTELAPQHLIDAFQVTGEAVDVGDELGFVPHEAILPTPFHQMASSAAL